MWQPSDQHILPISSLIWYFQLVFLTQPSCMLMALKLFNDEIGLFVLSHSFISIKIYFYRENSPEKQWFLSILLFHRTNYQTILCFDFIFVGVAINQIVHDAYRYPSCSSLKWILQVPFGSRWHLSDFCTISKNLWYLCPSGQTMWPTLCYHVCEHCIQWWHRYDVNGSNGDSSIVTFTTCSTSMQSAFSQNCNGNITEYIFIPVFITAAAAATASVVNIGTSLNLLLHHHDYGHTAVAIDFGCITLSFECCIPYEYFCSEVVQSRHSIQNIEVLVICAQVNAVTRSFSFTSLVSR